ncbi:MAG: DUF4123 domain-containing protein [Fibrobacterales bacterium]
MESTTEISLSYLLASLLWPRDTYSEDSWVYAVLDGAHSPEILSHLGECFTRNDCLYEGVLTDDLKEVAPYLVRLRKEEPYTDWLLENMLSKNWGVFLKSDMPFKELRKHLRRFLRVKSESNKTMLFRWYDPRVLRKYLPTCNEDELTTFFGSIHCFIVKGEEPHLYQTFSISNSLLEQRDTYLSEN